MAGQFLEERIDVGIRYGSSYSDDYNVIINETSDGSEYRTLVHPYPKRVFRVSYLKDNDVLYTSLVNLYHRVYGRYAGFRAKALDDYTTNGLITAPSAFDQTLTLVSTGIYQLVKRYGTDATGIGIGQPLRIIYKPVTGTVLVGVNGQSCPITTMWTVSTITGKVTFVANKTRAITAITKAANAVASCAGHTFVAGETVHFTGVAGMTQINGLRGTIVSIVASVSITVNIDSTAFSTYTSGGTLNTNPQTGESVTGGCEFDIPVRFNSAIDIMQTYPTSRETGEIELVELLNP